MIHDLYEMIPKIDRLYMRDDQVKYTWEKAKKRPHRIRITIGDEIAEKLKIGKGSLLKVEWNDKDKILIISRSNRGFKIYQWNRKRIFLLFNEPKRAKLPHIKKVFTNIPIDGQGEMYLDFSMEDGS